MMLTPRASGGQRGAASAPSSAALLSQPLSPHPSLCPLGLNGDCLWDPQGAQETPRAQRRQGRGPGTVPHRQTKARFPPHRACPQVLGKLRNVPQAALGCLPVHRGRLLVDKPGRTYIQIGFCL